MKASAYTVSDQQEAYIGGQVASGRFGSGEEVVAEALRQHEERHQKDQQLLEVLDKAMEGPFHDFEPGTFKAEMREKFGDRYPA